MRPRQAHAEPVTAQSGLPDADLTVCHKGWARGTDAGQGATGLTSSRGFCPRRLHGHQALQTRIGLRRFIQKRNKALECIGIQ